MKRGIIVSLLCFIFLFMHAPFAVQAEYIPEDAVASVKTPNSSETFYNKLDGHDGAVAAAQKEAGSTLKLLKDVDLESNISISKGDFIFDFNGKTLTNTKDYSAIVVGEGKFLFTDSSAQKDGGIIGRSTALSIREAEVTITGGNYKANGSACDVFGEKAIVEIYGGTFQAAVALNNSLCTYTIINGGIFYGTEDSVRNNSLLNIDGGQFKNGIWNTGTLNLSGGTIGGTGESVPAYGVWNEEEAELCLLGDVDITASKADFYLRTPMNIGGELSGIYRVFADVPADGSDLTFANATGSEVLNKNNFKSVIPAYCVKAVNGNTALVLHVCDHKDFSEQYVCSDCGLQLCAQVGENYYPSLKDAFEAVKNVAAEDGKIVKVLVDVDLEDNEAEDGYVYGENVIFDLNGRTITGRMLVLDGDVTIVGNGGTLESNNETLGISEGASVELKGALTVKGDVGICNYGNLKLNGSNVSVIGETSGILNFMGMVDISGANISGNKFAVVNAAGELNISGGTVEAEHLAVSNMGGTLTVGADNGSGPVLRAETGILNAGISVGEDGNLQEYDAATVVNGGEIIAETDIYNQTGDIPSAELADAFSVTSGIAGEVTLSGGTFTDGISVSVDEGVDLADLLADGYGYFDEEDTEVVTEEGTAAVAETVTVKKIEKDTDNSGGGTDSGIDSGMNSGEGNTGNHENGSGQQSGTNSGVAATGDEANIIGWVSAMLIAAAVVVAIWIRKKMKK